MFDGSLAPHPIPPERTATHNCLYEAISFAYTTTTLAPGKAIVSAQVDETQREELLRLARAGDRTLSGEIRRALELHLEQNTRTERKTTS